MGVLLAGNLGPDTAPGTAGFQTGGIADFLIGRAWAVLNRRYFQGPQVRKPAIQQTGKSAVLGAVRGTRERGVAMPYFAASTTSISAGAVAGTSSRPACRVRISDRAAQSGTAGASPRPVYQRNL